MSLQTSDTIQRKIVKPLLSDINSDSYNNRINLKHISGSLKSIIINSIRQNSDFSPLVICETNKEAEDYYHDFVGLADQSEIVLLTKPIRKSNIQFDGEDISFWLIDGLVTILNSKKPIIVITKEVLGLDVPPPQGIKLTKSMLVVGTEINLEQLSTELLLNGFDRTDFVSSQGELSIRGGILDVFPIDWESPIRIEFFGDEIESIRTFDSLSQRSIERFNEIEFITKIYHKEDEDSFVSNVFDYLSNDTIVFDDLPENNSYDDEIQEKLNRYRTVTFNRLGKSDYIFKSYPQPDFQKSIRNLRDKIVELNELGYHILLCADGVSNLSRLKELLENAFLSYDTETISNFEYDTLIDKIAEFRAHSFSSGFISDDLKLAVFNEHAVFGRARIQDRSRHRKKKGGLSVQSLRELNIGDMVVHEDKGIGAFDGLEIVELGGRQQECIRIIYDGNDLLYVHLNYMHKLHKYNSEEGVTPKLSKLSSSEWARKKSRTKKKLKDIARDLIKLYAERKAKKGYRFPKDTIWQKEFEAAFIYEDTIDQATTSEDVKSDMESSTPMDRLVCGDVGFGKTEIAIRAAFKAVQDGKQVAVLVPTTILSHQHYMSFSDRLSDYPVNIDVISRFRTSAQQKEIIEKTKEGKVDILIGTHRLLSKDINFRDLGLLVIDEEHRFGVGNKEKLKAMKANVDTLTLTATPIPRTLNFSLMGARDLSVIETAPRNRLPIETEILEWNEDDIKNAIETEIKRGGQVFFVSDKVEDLELILYDLQKLLSGIRFCMVHGQMPTREIEKNMEKFIEGKFDVMVATKIIESGLDIPNANTIIINRANRFGLAELYQLRGRVGRSNTQAFCLLLIQDAKKLTLQSVKRLQAIEEFSDLGSGFQLALRDLEIRGAGNLLGAEQSGFIYDMGFEMYQKILDEAVRELRIEEFPNLETDIDKTHEYLENKEIQIDINATSLLPNNFIRSDKERFQYYKRLFNIESSAELDDIIEELKDKFGRIPDETNNLFFAVKLRISGLNTGLKRIEFKHKKLTLEFPDSDNIQFYEEIFPDLIDVISSFENSLMKQSGKRLVFEINVKNEDEAVERIWRIKKTIESML